MCRKGTHGITLRGGTYISAGTLRTAEAGLLTPKTTVAVNTGFSPSEVLLMLELIRTMMTTDWCNDSLSVKVRIRKACGINCTMFALRTAHVKGIKHYRQS
eukprot:10347283-Ditylum_brightwellii.AAC.1